MAVSNTTKALKDIMRIDAGINGDAQYIEQITWMLFLKAFDYKEQEWELTEEDYYPVIPQEYRWSTWADDAEGITGDNLLDFIGRMFSALRELDTSDDSKKRKWLIRSVMEGVNNFMKSGTELRKVINKINEDINFDEVKGSHLFNDLYEGMLKDLQSAGKSGEFYTPRPVTRFIVRHVAPKLGESILDPACGTGGFLTSVVDSFTIDSTEDYTTLQKTIHGIEKKPFPYLLCMTNLIAHGIDVPDIRHDNTLRTPISDYPLKDKVDVIVTNPPFGGAENKAISQSVPAELRNTETADLFLVHIMALLKDGGRCGLVLPDGFLLEPESSPPSRKNFWKSAICIPSFVYRKAFLRPTPQSIPTCCFSPKAVRPKASGSTGWKCPKATSTFPRPSRCWTAILPLWRIGGESWKTEFGKVALKAKFPDTFLWKILLPVSTIWTCAVFRAKRLKFCRREILSPST